MPLGIDCLYHLSDKANVWRNIWYAEVTNVINEYIRFYRENKKNDRVKRGVSTVIHEKYKKNIIHWQEFDELIMVVELKKNNRDNIII